MNTLFWFMFLAFAVVLVQSKQLDPGPQTFVEKTLTVQRPQKRYAIKEVVVYLTPSQIKAIQEGKGYISTELEDQTEGAEANQDELEESQPEQSDIFDLSPAQLDSQRLVGEQQIPSLIPVNELNLEQIGEEPQLSWPEEKKFIPSPEDAYAYWRYYPETETQTEQTQQEPEESAEVVEELQPEVPQAQQQRYKLVPYDTATGKNVSNTTKAPQEDPIRERWLRLLELNRAQIRKQLSSTERTTSTITTTEKPKAKSESTFSRLQFSARYNDQKQAIENEERKKSQSEKQNATRPVSLTNSTSLLIRKEVTITKHQQAPLIKHVKVPTPVLVPIPEPFEVKVPHPFPVPLEFFRPVSNQIAKIKKLDPKISPTPTETEIPRILRVKKPTVASTEKPASERRVVSGGKKEVTAEVPSRQRGQPESITIIRHTWEN
ncbi:uncharacterized protein [Battus philenor]|uniref:uncharacterized protein n=1 Tax=Battus philenor TaxID=42288 RepID=UPI0035D133C2